MRFSDIQTNKSVIVMGSMRFLIGFLIILALLLYIKSIHSVKESMIIIQTRVSSLNPDMLLEKQPILVYDAIVNIDQFIGAAFRFLYIWAQKKDIPCERNVMNTNKSAQYMLIHASHGNTNVVVRNPRSKQTSNVMMYDGNVLIVPFKWEFMVVGDGTPTFTLLKSFFSSINI
jgi:hypothetical protein